MTTPPSGGNLSPPALRVERQSGLALSTHIVRHSVAGRSRICADSGDLDPPPLTLMSFPHHRTVAYEAPLQALCQAPGLSRYRPRTCWFSGS